MSENERMGTPASEERSRWRYVSRACEIGALAVLGHFGGVTATNIAPAEISTQNYDAEVSLDWTSFNEVLVPSSAGDVRFGFDSAMPSPSIKIAPKINPAILDSFAHGGVESISPTDTSLSKAAESAKSQLAERYLVGAGAAEAILLALKRPTSRRRMARGALSAVLATGIAAGYEGGSAALAYTSDNYRSYRMDGLADALQSQGSAVLNGLDERSGQFQRYVSAWVNLRSELTKAATNEKRTANGEGPSFMLVSDIHNINMTSMIAEVASREDVAAVIDTGDLLVAGRVQEAEITNIFSSIEKIKKPYIFVLGNHDKSSQYDTALIDRLEKIPNVIVLQPTDDTFTEVTAGGVKIAGVNDFVRWYGDNHNGGDTPLEQLPVVQKFNKTFEKNPPDIALTHQPTGSRALVHRGVTVAGHTHQSAIDGSSITSGTLTGGGLFGQYDTPKVTTDGKADTSSMQSFGILHFDNACQPQRLEVSNFQGMYSGELALQNMSFYFFPEKRSAAPARVCEGNAITTRTVPAAK